MPEAVCKHRGCEDTADVVRDTVGGNCTLTYCAAHDPLADPRVNPYFETEEVGP